MAERKWFRVCIGTKYVWGHMPFDHGKPGDVAIFPKGQLERVMPGDVISFIPKKFMNHSSETFKLGGLPVSWWALEPRIEWQWTQRTPRKYPRSKRPPKHAAEVLKDGFLSEEDWLRKQGVTP